MELPPNAHRIRNLFYRKNVGFARGRWKFVGLNKESGEKPTNLVWPEGNAVYRSPAVLKIRETQPARPDQAAAAPWDSLRPANREGSSSRACSHRVRNS